MIKSIRSNPSVFGVEENELWNADKLMMNLQAELLDGNILSNCIEQQFDDAA